MKGHLGGGTESAASPPWVSVVRAGGRRAHLRCSLQDQARPAIVWLRELARLLDRRAVCVLCAICRAGRRDLGRAMRVCWGPGAATVTSRRHDGVFGRYALAVSMCGTPPAPRLDGQTCDFMKWRWPARARVRDRAASLCRGPRVDWPCRGSCGAGGLSCPSCPSRLCPCGALTCPSSCADAPRE